MTWSARITRPDGMNPENERGVEDYSACMSCKHGDALVETGHAWNKQINPCNVSKVAHTLAPIMTSVDIGADGHMAGGEALLRCSGYEPKE